MGRYREKAINLIADAFENHTVEYEVRTFFDHEVILTGFSIKSGSAVTVMFVSIFNGNDVTARVTGIVSDIPKEMRNRAIETCNLLNIRNRFIKFFVDDDNDINIQYDFPSESPDDKIGEMAFEIFVRIMHALDAEYSFIIKELFNEDVFSSQGWKFSR